MLFEEVKHFILNKIQQELPQNLSYHSLEHVKDVYSSAEALAVLEQVGGEELQLLLTAVLFHDTGFLRDQKEHEKVGCEIAREYLPTYGYTPGQIEKICGMIIATKIPQQPKTHLEMIICDADLDYLGREDFFVIGKKLFDELCMYGIISSESEWNKLQKRFLESHTYFTESAKKLRLARKEEHIAIVTSKIHD